MGIRAASPTPPEPPLSNQTWFSFIVRYSINCAVQHRALRIGVAAHLGRFLPNLGRSPERPLLGVKR